VSVALDEHLAEVEHCERSCGGCLGDGTSR